MKQLLILISFCTTIINIGHAQQGRLSHGDQKKDWLELEEKMHLFANLENEEFSKYASNKKHSWKKAFVFDDSLGLFPKTEFLYGYTNTKLEYIEVIISNISNRRGEEVLIDVEQDLKKIESILNRVVDPNLKKLGSLEVRKECLICSDSTTTLWKNEKELGTKFLEKRFVTLEYYKFEGGMVEITFYNDRRELANFLDDPTKKSEQVRKESVKTESKDILKVPAGVIMKNDLQSKESQFVFYSLKTMRFESSSSTNMKATIDPTFINSNFLNSREYWINGFRGLAGFKIVEQSGDEVAAYVWGKNQMWVHKLIFKVIQKEEQHFLIPKGMNEGNYIDPWYKIERFVKVDANELN